MKGATMVKFVEPPQGGTTKAVMPTAQVIALRARDPWKEATNRARQVGNHRETVVAYVRTLTNEGVTQNNAVKLLLERSLANILPAHFAVALSGSAKAGRVAPSRSAICQWCAAYREGGITALLPDHKGRVVEVAGWWGPALEYFNKPGKPDMSAVYRRLFEVDGFAVTYDQVCHYLNGVPAMVGRNSPARIGKKLYRLTQKAFVRRSTENALPGDVYVADGYRADVYLAHPMTGDIWRPELTVAIDLRSRKVVGWRADEHEGTVAVQNMWAEAFDRHNHVPLFLYIDNGSGYKNKLMSDEMVGFYGRAGVNIIHTIPGNPHGKGWVERFFRSVKDDFFKLWMPQFYCGTDMASEVLSKTVTDCKAGRLIPPSLAQFTDAFDAWLERYDLRPHPEDKHTSRAALWSGLVPIPPHTSLLELKREAVKLTVRRATLKHKRREYSHPDLHAFNGQKLLLEYDLMDNSVGIVRTLDGRWICDANLIKSIDVIAPNRLEEKRVLRAKNAIKRLQKKIDEQKARSGLLIDAEAVADAAMPALEGDVELLPDDDELLLDLTLDEDEE